MLTLSIFRHAKASAGDATTKDIDRPLAERGIKAAPRMGAYLVKQDLRPDLVLSSPSARTRETCALAFAAFPTPLDTRFEDVLYLASPTTLLGCIRRTAPAVRHLMLVGHNPGLQALALDLIASAPRKPLSELTEKLPTAGLVVLTLQVPDWTGVAPQTATLARFVTPGTLAP